ncbi:MAG: glycerol-3-phosphate 1-O-acyltransferase PlsY [Christensenellales bacterium]|jgi:glycerol-3-phosphate acyltransferase PlsY
MTWLTYVACGAIGYLLGCFSTAYIASTLIARKDIRNYGSGNAGTSNMLRTFGVTMGILTFIGDVAKGVGAVLLGRLIGGALGECLAGFFVIIGHIYPFVLGFKGGKGIATIAGVLCVIYPVPGLILVGACVLIIALTRMVSVGSLIGCVAMPIMSYFLGPDHYCRIVMFLLIAIVSIVAHRSNIVRLLKGTENKFDFSKLKK